MKLRLVFFASVLAIAGCSKPCRPGTALATLRLLGPAIPVDQLEVWIGDNYDNRSELRSPKSALVDGDSLEIIGASSVLNILARREGAPVAFFSGDVDAAPTCTTPTVERWIFDAQPSTIVPTEFQTEPTLNADNSPGLGFVTTVAFRVADSLGRAPPIPILELVSDDATDQISVLSYSIANDGEAQLSATIRSRAATSRTLTAKAAGAVVATGILSLSGLPRIDNVTVSGTLRTKVAFQVTLNPGAESADILLEYRATQSNPSAWIPVPKHSIAACPRVGAVFVCPREEIDFSNDCVGRLQPELLEVRMTPLVSSGALTGVAGAVVTDSVAIDNRPYFFPLDGKVPAPRAPDRVVAADLNGDGALDLVATGFDGTAQVSLGQHNGRFVAGQTFFAGGPASAILADDLDDDGRPDLVVLVNAAKSMNVFLGNGDGSFKTSASIATGNVPTAAIAADFDGDGKRDLAFANGHDHTISVVHGDGVGGFSMANTITVAPAQYLAALTAGDFDGDGRVDLAAADLDGSVKILHNDGATLVFTAAHALGSSGPQQLIAADFDGDQDLDLAVANERYDSLDANMIFDVQILLGDGAGGFALPQRFTIDVTYTGEARAAGQVGLTSVDLDRDGALDLATANSRTAAVNLLLGNGSGSFGMAATIYQGIRPTDLASGDLDGDGRVDLVVADAGRDHLPLLMGHADGSISAPKHPSVGATQPFKIVAADFDDDGNRDLVTVNQFYDGVENLFDVRVLLGHGDATFDAPRIISLPADSNPVAVAATDVNGDAKGDLVLALVDGSIAVFIGQGDGSFAPVPIHPRLGVSTTSLAAIDLSGDGIIDLVTTDYAPTAAIAIFTGVGDGTFLSPSTILTQTFPSSLATGDFNADGWQDLAISHASLPQQPTSHISVFLSVAPATFAPATTYAVGNNPTTIVSGDFDQDGSLDLATHNQESADLSLLYGANDGTFSMAMSHPWSFGSRGVVAVDLNRDAVLDFVGGVPSASLINLLVGDGDRHFPGSAFVPSGLDRGIDRLVAGDLNNDGAPDLATLVTGSTEIALLLNGVAAACGP